MPNAGPGTVIIIGGANGIGEATARLMQSRGWSVAVADRDVDAALRLAREIDGYGLGLDIAMGDEVDAAAEKIEREVGPVSALIVTAAVFQEVQPPIDLPIEVWERNVQVNLTGTYRANRAFGTRMARRGHGSIINTASIAALGSMPVYAYGTTKAAVVSLTKNLAGEWGRSGVRVNCISPGSTLVPRVRERLKTGRYASDPGDFTALGRMVQPEEVAEVFEFLASSRASAITGVNLVVDCGWHVAQTWAQHGGLTPPYERAPE